MRHKPIEIKNLALDFPHKTCFSGFNALIAAGDRIALMGRNGSGKSSLLKMLAGMLEPSEGEVRTPEGLRCRYVPQVIEENECLSGGERLQAALQQALAADPDLLLLDEPTNHLDRAHRQQLFQDLQACKATLVVVSHDAELLGTLVDRLWHLDDQKVSIFSGQYEAYLEERRRKRSSIEGELAQLRKQTKASHQKLMLEQRRAAQSRAIGKKSLANKKWAPILGQTKALQAEQTTGRKKQALETEKQALHQALQDLRLPEIIRPRFSIESQDRKAQVVLEIQDGSFGYAPDQPILKNINLKLGGKDRLAILGPNASGKSSLLRTIRGEQGVFKTGAWFTLQQEAIGYLDQHYANLDSTKSAFQTLAALAPERKDQELRQLLNDFLFRKNEEVHSPVSKLSGGEKARLSLAQIALQTPRLLMLDEISNNLDRETKDHLIQVLNAYPGALIVISHEPDFLAALDIDRYFSLDPRADPLDEA